VTRPVAGAVPEHLRRRYLRGGCFALAREMHRVTGLPLFGLRDAAGDLHHALVGDPAAGTFWDIRGEIPRERVAEGSAAPGGVVAPLSREDLEAEVGSFDLEDLQAAAHAIRTWLVPAGLPLASSGVPSLVPDPEAPGPDAARAELYGQGSCHVFALAALDALADLGSPRGFRVVFDAQETFWENPEDPDDVLRAVLHVYAVFDVEGCEVAVDVFGVRDLEAAEAEASDRFGVVETLVEDFGDFSEMAHLVESDADLETGVDRPLHSLSTEDLEAAGRDVREIFALGVPVPALCGEDAPCPN
jgi:hypothetical protein